MSNDEKEWFEKFFKTHIQICDELKTCEKKHKRSPEYFNATQDFIKLESFKNYVIESNMNDF